MPESRSTAKVILLPEGATPNLEEDAERGYRSHVLVEVNGSFLYPVTFYTASRLKGELDISARNGEPYIAETGMIVLHELTLEAMQTAVQAMCNAGYFDYMLPLSRERISQADPLIWPP